MPLSFLWMILRNPAAHPQGSDTPPPGSLFPDAVCERLSLQCPLTLHSHCLKIQCQRKKFPDHLPIIFIRHDTHDKMEFFIRIHCLQTFSAPPHRYCYAHHPSGKTDHCSQVPCVPSTVSGRFLPGSHAAKLSVPAHSFSCKIFFKNNSAASIAATAFSYWCTPSIFIVTASYPAYEKHCFPSFCGRILISSSLRLL